MTQQTNKLGSKIIGSKAKPGRLVTVEVTNADDSKEQVIVEVRSPVQTRVLEVLRRAGVPTDEEGKPSDFSKYLAAAVIESTYEVGTSNKVFAPDQLEQVDQLGAEFESLRIAVAELSAPPKDLGGKSEQTPSST